MKAIGSVLLCLAEDSSQQREHSQRQVLKHLHNPETCPHQRGRHQHGYGRDYYCAEYGDADAQEEGGQPGHKGSFS